MFNLIYSAPYAVTGTVFVAVFLLFAALGVLLVRRPAARMFSREQHWRAVTTLALQTCASFFALLLALAAITTVENHADARNKVSVEASAIAVLIRAASELPQPTRGKLEQEIASYVRYVVNESWPQQRRGKTPTGAVEIISGIQQTIFSFEPRTPKDEIILASSITAFQGLVEARRERISATSETLPRLLTTVLTLGVLITIALSWLLPVQSRGVHCLITGSITVTASLILFTIVALSYPFRGGVAISPSPYLVLLETRLPH
ncbi:Protein of unknown function DUF4239 [Actinobacteria bacterium OV450]|nr:Protein of unknown function DUF4239 [Actinobacteria bacterium OV450]